MIKTRGPVRKASMRNQLVEISRLRCKSGVTDLNQRSVLERLSADGFRSVRFLPSAQSYLPPTAQSTCFTSRRRLSGAAFRVPPAAHLHGPCSTDLLRRTAQHRDLFEREAQSAIPSGLLRAGRQVHPGLRQRAARLVRQLPDGRTWPRPSCARPELSTLKKISVWNWRTRSNALDSGTNDLSFTLLPWAEFRSTPRSTSVARFPRASTSAPPVNLSIIM